MPRRLIVSDPADLDLHAALEWTREHHLANLDRFADEVSATLNMLQEAPFRWTLWHRSRVRRCLLPHLPYSFYYRVDEHSVFIDAFLHHRQDATGRFPKDQ